MKLIPLGDRVIVKPNSKDEITASGIVLPEGAAKEKPEQGKVVSVGPGKMLDNGSRAGMSVKKGQTVVFKEYSPDTVKIEDKEYLIVREDDILAIIE